MAILCGARATPGGGRGAVHVAVVESGRTGSKGDEEDDEESNRQDREDIKN